MIYTFAHLSDPHVGPVTRQPWAEMWNKRLTGYWNWKQHRRLIHNMDVLRTIIDDIKIQQPDHIALTGDLVNIGHANEFAVAEANLQVLGNSNQVSIVPGNHDAYVSESLGLMQNRFGAFMTGDDGRTGFPYLRCRGPLALIGVSSAIPTLPLLADGMIGDKQAERFATLLAKARKDHDIVVVMIHHPPHQGGARRFRGLRDAAKFEQILAQHGANLIIHGHNHKRSLAYRPGPEDQSVPIIGVASASAVPGDPLHCAAYHLFRFDLSGPRISISMDVRGMRSPHGQVELLDHINLSETP